MGTMDLNEQARLASLCKLDILDTPTEERFDRYTALAAAAFSVPIALISLVDAERQWFKSRHGLDAREIPRALAFCNHAIASEDAFVVSDALRDPAFAGNPLVTGAPHVRFYAGHPIRSDDGHAVGTLCIIDSAPRQFDTAARTMLASLAAMVEAELNKEAAASARASAKRALQELNAALTESEDRLRTITNNVPVLIAYLDHELRYRFANAMYKEWLGVRHEEMVGRSVREVFGDDYFGEREAGLKLALAGHMSSVESNVHRKSRARVLSTTYIPHLRDGVTVGIYVLSTDATASREHERHLLLLANADPLTALPNRRMYQEHLKAALARARRHRSGLALMYLDLDNFKHINDTLGHGAGDEVLVAFGRRIKGVLRDCDLLARLAGDEFTVVLDAVDTGDACALVASKILAALQDPFLIDGKALAVGASIGVALAVPGDSADALGNRADSALYAAKRAGKNRFSVLANAPGIITA